MRTRLDLHWILCDILGSNNVYFRPPSSGMKYPCIIYDLDGDSSFFADNQKYINPKRWSLTLVDEDPDSPIFDRLNCIKYCSFNRKYQADGLNHFVFTLYF